MSTSYYIHFFIILYYIILLKINPNVAVYIILDYNIYIYIKKILMLHIILY